MRRSSSPRAELQRSVAPSVLLVDDTPANLIALSAVLKPLGAELVEASSGAEAIAHVARREFAVALVDVQMPEMDGFELATRIRSMERGRELPIIFLTAIHRDDRFVKKGYASGGADYITKPFDAEIVRARVRAFVDLFEQRESVRRAQVALRTEERDDALKKLVAFERIATAALVVSDLSAFLHELCSVFMAAANAADCVCLLIRNGAVLKQEACFGLNEEVDERLVLNVGEGFAGKIAADAEPLEITKASTSPLVRSSWLRERGTNALYGVPLMHENEVVGVAFIGSKPASAFPEHEKRLFRALAQRAGMAIGQHFERSRLLELERKARIDAEEANRLKDEFLALVSHELRSPLNAILGWTVTARAKAPPELDRALAIVERNARAQARILEDVLDVSSIVSGKLRLVVAETSVATVVERALEVVKPAADAKQSEIIATVDEGATLLADGQRLEQIIGNLLSNAIKFSPKRSKVEISARRDGERISIFVSDRGEGIAADFLPHVFEAFRQADSSNARRHGGLGLGLSIVHRLVVAHGGNIVATSPGRGQGATFTVTLPVRSAIEGTPNKAATNRCQENQTPVRLEGLNVLVVDDDDDARSLLESVLRERGAHVLGAGSASEGLNELVRSRPDLVISDIAMPGGDGYGLIRAVRALAPERGGLTPAIAVTAHARDSDGERAIEAGFQTYFSKPTDIENLVSRVAHLCGRVGRDVASHTKRS
jgi:signal transduction histidine kinase